MSLARDGSTPAAVDGTGITGASQTTASFSPPAGSFVVIAVAIGYLNTTGTGPTVSCADSLSNAYAAGPADYSGVYSGAYIFTHYYATAPGSITVTVTRSGQLGQAMFDVVPYVLTGVGSAQAGAGSAHTSDGSVVTSFTGSITTTETGSWAIAVASLGGRVALTASGLSTDHSYLDNTDTVEAAAGHAVTGTPGATVLGWTSASATSYAWAALEILPTSGQSVSLVRAQETIAAHAVAPLTGVVKIPVAQVSITGLLDFAGPRLGLPPAQVTVRGYVPIRGHFVDLPVVRDNIRAYGPHLPVVLQPRPAVQIRAWAPFVGAPPPSPGGLPVLFGSALGGGTYLPGMPGGPGGPGGPPAPGISSITGKGTGWEVAVLAAPQYADLLAVIPAKLLIGQQFTQQLGDTGSGTVTLSMDDPWWGPGWSFQVDGNPGSDSRFICTAAQAAGIAAGDTFSWSGQPGTVFTVTQVVPAGASAQVYFTPPVSGG